MKTILTLALLLPTLSAHAADLTLVQCTYRIIKPDGKIHEMIGNLVAEDAQIQKPYGTTYLTLAPNQLSGDTTEARILITSDGYNPITLHKAGQSATTIGATEMGPNGGELIVTVDGTTYSVICKKR
jgi:hypothetical protein